MIPNDLWAGLLCAGLLSAFILLVVVVPHFIQQRMAKIYPPITDDEFMARLPAGTSREVALKVRRIIADQLNVEYARIHPDTSWSDLEAY